VIAAVIGAWAWRRSADEGAVVGRRVLRVAAVLALLAFVWVAIVAAMTEGGYAGNPRYLVAPLGVFLPVGIAGIAWTARLLAARGGVRAGELAVTVALALLVVAAADRLPRRTADNAYQAANRVQLEQLAERPGLEAQIKRCGPIVTHPLLIPPVAWTLGLHVNDIEFHEHPAGGTYIVGRNVEANLARPTRVAPGAREIARSGQLAIYQSC